MTAQHFDTIIVGAGSAGCVLADRLSRDGNSRVLLIEAGAENGSPFIRMPRGHAKIWMNPAYYWMFPVEPQSFRPANETWVYGKGLGGSSSVNGTWYYRGQPRDYDTWEAMGNTGWNWQAMERSFRAIEDFAETGADPSRGKGGPVQVTAIRSKSPLTEALFAAGRQMGLPFLADVNQPGTHGIGRTQMTVDRRGNRVSAYTAFVRGAVNRPNLRIETRLRVKKVLFDGLRAIGVCCLDRAGREIEFRAAETILCAGVLQSPKLLQLSGIGPREVLDRHGITPVRILPAVGRNMTEHMMVSMAFRLNGLPGLNREFRGWRLWKNVLQYFLSGRGLMSYGLPEVSAMLSTTGDASWPDMQLGISPYSYAASPESKAEPGRGLPEQVPGISVSAFQLRPSSRGSVAIRSADVDDPPIVDANWLDAEEDRQAAITLIRTVRRFMRQPALVPYVGEESVPGAAAESDEEVLTAAHWLLSSGLHGTGTCRMGAPSDSVVDARLRVHGVSGLRVVDCSVMPTTVSGNTNGPAMALAWRAADLILEERKTSG